VESTFSINRKDFGINYAGAANNLIRDEVVMSLHIKADRAK
jgi:polyisoprenoid-binding protein YceI